MNLFAFRVNWFPYIDMGLKISAVLSVVGTLISLLILNYYLSAIGQTGVTLDLAGPSVTFFLILFICVLPMVGVSFPLIYTRHFMLREMPAKGWPLCLYMVCLWLLVAIVLFLQHEYRLPDFDPRYWLFVIFLGLCPVLWVLVKYPWKDEGRKHVWSSLLLFGSTFFLFVEITVVGNVLLGLRISGDWAVLIPVFLSCLVMFICLFAPAGWAIVGIFGLMLGLILRGGPGPVILMQNGLFNSNLGGGVPAQAITSDVTARICNLGIAERPVIYFAENGCTKKAALEHLQKLVDAKDPGAKEAKDPGAKEAKDPGAKEAKDPDAKEAKGLSAQAALLGAWREEVAAARAAASAN
ncbi:hypothetical protein KM176_20885 [Pseudooceanicola sp. CBS1P-1]|uniref:Uncharacterized protein n=1 Tax=Pseudooceanicola albus TaxID=2692189 RepID=A0A6L7GC56_9RHOB|nr:MULTISPECIES: hypothetical protein [Pseudooceanicola]MBT9386338.1 hypothetical protein [Pseudooceanicola endophyticus]MXN21177.1 hypothetical protein [Pseudooceanicola albus]